MSKTKTPFLSLGSQGTVGGVLTTQKRGQETLVREKPIPAYTRTLPQQYQRWLYEDYAYLWTQQSAATRQEYASSGVRHHLTGFQYWMKVMLSTLPDIAGMWHLDRRADAIAYDSSKNTNHGTVFGASPHSGVIDGCLFFDGINDRILIPDAPSLDLRTAITAEAFVRPHAYPHAWNDILSKRLTYYFTITNAKRVGILLSGTAPPGWFYSNTNVEKAWTHVAFTYDGITLTIYINGIFDRQRAQTGLINVSAHPPMIGSVYLMGPGYDTNRCFHGSIDHVPLRSRCLDPSEILRHSLRRYPA